MRLPVGDFATGYAFVVAQAKLQDSDRIGGWIDDPAATMLKCGNIGCHFEAVVHMTKQTARNLKDRATAYVIGLKRQRQDAVEA
jgi:hypothetical protein